MLHANLLNTQDIDPNSFRGNPLESVCVQISATRKKGKNIWTPQRAKEQLIELAAEDIDRDVEVLEASLTANVAFLKATVLKFAERNDLTCYVLCGRRLEHKITAPKRNNVEPLIFAEWDTRLYFYTGAKTKEKVAQMVVRPPREIPREALQTDPKRKPCEIEIPRALGQTWEEDPATLPPGEYITMHRCNDPDEWDIQKVRVRLLLAGINPEVNMCSLHDGYYYNKLTGVVQWENPMTGNEDSVANKQSSLHATTTKPIANRRNSRRRSSFAKNRRRSSVKTALKASIAENQPGKYPTR